MAFESKTGNHGPGKVLSGIGRRGKAKRGESSKETGQEVEAEQEEETGGFRPRCGDRDGSGTGTRGHQGTGETSSSGGEKTKGQIGRTFEPVESVGTAFKENLQLQSNSLAIQGASQPREHVGEGGGRV